jgi:LysR family glycine cleavage system transcriptional activator
MERIPPKMPALTALRAFEAAARHGSFTQAAEELSMTQAAISYQVKQLENGVSQQLFRRNGRYIELTDAGRQLSEATSEAFDLIRSAAMSLVEIGDTQISISALPTVASHWLVPRLGRFQKARPDMAVRLETSLTISDVLGDFDLAIRSGMGSWPGCDAHLLFKSDFALVCSPMLVASGQLSRIDDVFNVPRFGREAWWKQWLAATKTESPAGAFPVSDLGMQANEVAAALKQNGVALVTPRFFADEIADADLVIPFSIRVEEERSYWLVHRRGAVRAKTRYFRDWILGEARE